LWVSYDIELLKPRIDPGLTDGFWTLIGNGPYTAASNVLGTVETWAGDDFSCARFSPSNHSLCYPSGASLKAQVRSIDSEGFYVPVDVEVSEEFEAQGPPPIGESLLEEVRDVVNDTMIPFSLSVSAIQPLDTHCTEGVQTMFIGADSDVLCSGWTVPRINQNAGNYTSRIDTTPLMKIRNLFYGVHHDTYVESPPIPTKWGSLAGAKQLVFPYSSNAQYYGPASLINDRSSTETPFGPVFQTSRISLTNCRFFYPWNIPAIAGVSDPRITSRTPNSRKTSSNTPMKGKSFY